MFLVWCFFQILTFIILWLRHWSLWFFWNLFYKGRVWNWRLCFFLWWNYSLSNRNFKISNNPIIKSSWCGNDEKVRLSGSKFIIKMAFDPKVLNVDFEVIGLTGWNSHILQIKSIFLIIKLPLDKGSKEFKISLPVMPPPIIPILNYEIKAGLFFYIIFLVLQAVLNKFRGGRLFRGQSIFSMN